MIHRHDDEIAWMAALDWSSHGTTARQHVSKRLFLAGAAEAMGQILCAPWPLPHEGLLAYASEDHPGRVVLPEHAFLADGTPIASIHAAAGPDVRRHAERLLMPIVSPDAITFEEWDAVVAAGEDAWSLGIGARRAAAGLAPAFARLAYDKKVRCWARPSHGGDDDAKPIASDIWDLSPSMAVRRFASCGIALDAPYDHDAPITHRIFVEEGGLQNAFVEAARTVYVATAALEQGPWALKRDADHYAVSRTAVAELLISLMTDDHLHWQDAQFREAVSKRFGDRAMGRIYERARAIATAHPDRQRFRKRRPALPA